MPESSQFFRWHGFLAILGFGSFHTIHWYLRRIFTLVNRCVFRPYQLWLGVIYWLTMKPSGDFGIMILCFLFLSTVLRDLILSREVMRYGRGYLYLVFCNWWVSNCFLNLFMSKWCIKPWDSKRKDSERAYYWCWCVQNVCCVYESSDAWYIWTRGNPNVMMYCFLKG